MNIKRRMAGMGVAAGAALVAVFTAYGAGNTQISGEGVFDAGGACNEIPSVFTMVLTGDLVGCLYTHEYEVVQNTPGGVYSEGGTGGFIGCLAGTTKCGTLDTTYKFTAKYGPNGQIHGRCQHPITYGTGDFAGITGRLDFKDDVQTGIADYRGHIKLPNAAARVDERQQVAVASIVGGGCK